MASINPYLVFDGNCEAAFQFYRSVFGGEFPYLGRFGEMPQTEGQNCPPAEADKIMHVSLPIGPNTVLMGSDRSDAFGNPPFVAGNNFSISINAASRLEADRLYDALSAGGQRTMLMQDVFWGDYFGMLTDAFGIAWMISFAAHQQG